MTNQDDNKTNTTPTENPQETGKQSHGQLAAEALKFCRERELISETEIEEAMKHGPLRMKALLKVAVTMYLLITERESKK